MSINLDMYLKMNPYNPVFLRDSHNLYQYSLSQVGKTMTLQEQEDFANKISAKTQTPLSRSVTTLNWFNSLITTGVDNANFTRIELGNLLRYRDACENYIKWTAEYKFSRNNPIVLEYINSLVKKLIPAITEKSEDRWEYYWKLKSTIVRSRGKGLIDPQYLELAGKACTIMAMRTEELLSLVPPILLGAAKENVQASNSFSAVTNLDNYPKELADPVKIAGKLMPLYFSNLVNHSNVSAEFTSNLFDMVSKGLITEFQYESLRRAVEASGTGMYPSPCGRYDPLLDKINADSSGVHGLEFCYNMEEIMVARDFCIRVVKALPDRDIVSMVIRDVIVHLRSKEKYMQYVKNMLALGLINISQAEEYYKKGEEDFG